MLFGRKISAPKCSFSPCNCLIFNYRLNDLLGNDVVAVGDDLVLVDVEVAVQSDGPVTLLLDDGVVLHNDCGSVRPLGLGSLDAAILVRILVL